MILFVLSFLILYLSWTTYRKLTLWSRVGIPVSYGHFFRCFRMCSGHADLITVQEKGKLVGVYSFLTPTLLVGDATLAKVVLSTGFNDYVNHPRLQHEDHYMGQSVFSVDDDRWRQVRQIITPAFTSMKLRTMQPLIESSCLDLIEQLQLTNGKSVDMKILLCGFTMDVIASTGFGTKVNTARNPMNDIAVNGRKFLSSDMPLVAILVLSVPWLALDIFKMSFFPVGPSKFFHDLTLNVIKQRRQDETLKRNDFIQFLMDAEQDGVKLTDKEIADNGLLFFLAGHDTSSITLTHCLYLLALNQTVQETLHKEIDGLFATGQEINYDTIGQLEYIDCVIKETLRLIPTAARTSRIASRDTILGKAKVPKGTMVLISNHAIHQDASHFEDPEQFIPERFDKNSKLGHNPQAFVPFAPGPRNCIGERFAMFEMKLCLIRVLRMFKFEPCSTTKVPLDYYIGNMVFQPKEVYLRPVERHL